MTRFGWLIGLTSLLAVSPLTSEAQYLYLDSNADAVHSAADILRADGTTTLSIYLDLDRDRSGTVQSCNSHTKAAGQAGPIRVFSYDIILRVVKGTGTVRWGQYQDDGGFVGLGKDDLSDTEFRTSQWLEVGELDRETPTLPDGLRKLGHISVTPTSGDPSIEIAQSSSLDPTYFTGLGTKCRASEYRNTYMLGIDWYDTDGIVAAARKVDSEARPILDVRITPSPAREGVVIRLAVSKGIPATMEVFDAQGRLVFRNGEIRLLRGENMIRWDGRSSQGRRVASGVYFASVRAGSDRRLERFVVAR